MHFYISTKMNRPLKVLHVAPERLIRDLLLADKKVEYQSVDIRPNMALTKADLCDLPFRDDYFDIVICSHVLEHIKDDMKAMMEIYRVTKPGGEALVVVPMRRNEKTEENLEATPQERAKLFGSADHFRWYGQDFPDRIAKVGFKATMYGELCLANKEEVF